MKKLLLLFISVPFLCFSQVQIGQDIDGEAARDWSGYSISSSSDGSVVAIGAIGNDESAGGSGHVRVYENISGTWIQIGSDIDGEAIDNLSGYSVSLSYDGTVIAIGAVTNDGNSYDSGHVRVYENISGAWVQIGSDIDGEAEGDWSGSSVSLSSDGTVLAIGAHYNDGNGNSSGHVRIYQNISSIWTQIGTDIDGVGQGDLFGHSVSLSSDGTIVAIGAPGGTESVSVYENISGTWTQTGNHLYSEGIDDSFGSTVSISSDGLILAVGAPYNDGNGTNSGHVRVYRNISGTWTQIGSDIDGVASDNLFGESVSLSSDGSLLAIGAPRNSTNGTYSGHVRVYKNQSDVWTQIGIDINGSETGDGLGEAVSLSSDGSVIAIGAIQEFFNNTNGYSRVYDLSALLSVNEENLIGFQLYPNPTKDQFTIQLENSLELQNVNIYNNLGQLVITSKKNRIDVSKLTSGLYTVDIETNKGKGTQKLIIE